MKYYGSGWEARRHAQVTERVIRSNFEERGRSYLSYGSDFMVERASRCMFQLLLFVVIVPGPCILLMFQL